MVYGVSKMANKNRKNLKPVKSDRKDRISKNHSKKKVNKNSLKKVATTDITVNANELNWKSVDIPDTLDDFGGFYGLEEIDGVDVKVVDGKVQFITKDNKNVKKEPEQVEEKDNIVFQEDDEDVNMDELIEFKNFDDIKEGELSAASDDEESEFHVSTEEEGEEGEEAEDQEEERSEKENVKGEAGTVVTEDQTNDDLLQSNVFSSNVDIDDQEPPVLPEWSENMDLSFTVLKGLSGLGFTRPTEIQLKSIPLALKGHNIMGKASTGSGKTLAYGIPIIEQLIKDTSNDRSIGLIFTPTRELAHQVTDHLQKVWTKMNKLA